MCGRSSEGRWKVVCKAVAALCTVCMICVCVCVGGGKREGRRVYNVRVHLYECEIIVSCPAHAGLLVRNGLVNEVEFLGLIPQKW